MHSSWAAARLRQTDMPNTGLDTIVPMQTPAPVVERMVGALCSGFAELRDANRKRPFIKCMSLSVIAKRQSQAPQRSPLTPH